jgi:hypothetical protein
MSEQTAMVVDATRALEPSDLGQAWKLAGALAKSGLLGRDKARQEACFAIILAGRELGLTAMASLRSIHVIEGKTVLSADLIVALVKRSPECEVWRVTEWTGEKVTIVTKRKGDSAPTTLTWTIDEAKAAQLTGKDNWRKYPRAMLRARCSTELARAVYPELAMGLYDPDEVDARPAPVRVSTATPTNWGDLPDLDRPTRAPTPSEGVPASDPRPVAPEGLIAEQAASAGAADGVPEEDTAKALDVIQDIHEAASLEALGALGKRVRDLPKSVQGPAREAYTARKRALGAGQAVMP